jgi:hypothetical protein
MYFVPMNQLGHDDRMLPGLGLTSIPTRIRFGKIRDFYGLEVLFSCI